ncbi:AMP-binding protein, partial [Pedobacter steynii]|uniref:AMP-binding protein n=1 Tax=Pedobacter steynii TaxID=430522 RepID=UPI00155DB305
YLEKKEKEDLLAAAPSLPVMGNVVELLEAQVLLHPDAVALATEEGNYSYGELNALSNQLSAYLKEVHQVVPGERIGIKLERSAWMVASVIGVFKCGGTYVPIDPEYPEERIAYLLSNSACKVLLDEEELDRFKSVHLTYPTAKAEVLLDADALAYVIYTSGSTGNPKGVMVSHGNLS